jgi:hypothetical protein
MVLAIGPNNLFDRLVELNSLPPADLLNNLIEGRGLSYVSEFPLEVIRHAHAHLCGARLELPVKTIGHLANLNHLGHVLHMLAKIVAGRSGELQSYALGLGCAV